MLWMLQSLQIVGKRTWISVSSPLVKHKVFLDSSLTLVSSSVNQKVYRVSPLSSTSSAAKKADALSTSIEIIVGVA